MIIVVFVIQWVFLKECLSLLFTIIMFVSFGIRFPITILIIVIFVVVMGFLERVLIYALLFVAIFYQMKTLSIMFVASFYQSTLFVLVELLMLSFVATLSLTLSFILESFPIISLY